MSKPQKPLRKHSQAPQDKGAQRSEPGAAPPTVSGQWILSALAIALAAAALCCWGVLCLMFWQGSWQLLYHPTAAIRSTPASRRIAFEDIGLATTEAGLPQLKGWWIPADNSRFTAVYLHGADGSLGDTIDALARLHAAGITVLAFDYRGYGQSQFARPSEAHWREDAESALQYLTATRHLPPSSILLAGNGLGANLALELAASHPEIAGVIIDQPLASPADAIFNDSRARLVPAHLLVDERWDSGAAASELRAPSLWFFAPQPKSAHSDTAGIYQRVNAPKMGVWLSSAGGTDTEINSALARWLDDLRVRR